MWWCVLLDVENVLAYIECTEHQRLPLSQRYENGFRLYQKVCAARAHGLLYVYESDWLIDFVCWFVTDCV